MVVFRSAPALNIMRTAGVVLILVWIGQLLLIGGSWTTAMSAEYLPSGAWLHLSMHSVIALFGLASGIFLVLGNPIWKWFAIGSCVTLLLIADFGWFQVFSKAGGIGPALKFFMAHPKHMFSSILMPIFSVVVILFVLTERIKGPKNVSAVS